MNAAEQDVRQLFSARVRVPDRLHSAPPPTCLTLSVVVPLFDEEANLPELVQRLKRVLSELLLSWEVVLVNDGSRDRTAEQLNQVVERETGFVAVHLSRNFGHQAAVSAGLQVASGQAVVILDGDLQDPPELIPNLLEKWRAGSEVVYAVRATRQENALLQGAYRLFYRLLSRSADHTIPEDAGDCCLMDRQVVDLLNASSEQPRFLRGLRAYAGFRQCALPYDRAARKAGRSKYTLSKLLGLAFNGFFHFTKAPVKLLWWLTFSAHATFFGIACYVVGWNASPASLLALGGSLGISVLLLALAIVGEYLSRILTEVQGRPAFVVREVKRANTSTG